MFVVTSFRYIEVLFHLESKGFPITITAEAKNIVRYTEDILVNIVFHIEIPLESVTLLLVQIFLTVRTRLTPDQPRYESKGLHILIKVTLNNLPLNNLIH